MLTDTFDYSESLLNDLRTYSKEQVQDSILTDNSYMGRMVRAWLVEKNGPDLLPFQSELVDELSERIESQSDYLTDLTADQMENGIFRIVLLEVERAKFLLRSYLRARLNKVISICIFLLRMILICVYYAGLD